MSSTKITALTGIAIIFMSFSQSAIADDNETELLPSGTYTLIAIRRSSEVESTANAEPNIGDMLGVKAEFSDSFNWIDGTSCVNWHAKPIENDLVDLYAPNLSDLAVEKLDPPAYKVFAFSRTYEVYCSDNDLIPAALLVRVDNRTLVTLSPSGSFYLVLERPLTAAQISRLQEQLADMEFYSGEVSGVLDADTRSAISSYAEYRGAEYRFKDAVITENLLDGMDIF